MAKQKKQEARALSSTERLGLRVSAMINSPKAQLERRAAIHRLDTDTDEAWDGVMELLGETDGLHLGFTDDGGVVVTWAKPEGDDASMAAELDEEAVQVEPAF